jgi:hypothetical protein
MNAPYPPVDFSNSGSDLSALLQLLVDPVKTKARLDGLIAQEAATKEQIATLNAMADKTRRAYSTAAATDIVSNNRAAALDKREAELDDRARQLEQSESTRSDAALRRREDAVQAREQAVKAELDRLNVARKDVEARLSKIKSFSSTL